MREAWERGVVLCRLCAGMLLVRGLVDRLVRRGSPGWRTGWGFLPGSNCPHYDGEDQRRPLYRRLIAEEGFPPGFAADDAAALVFEGTSLREVVCTAAGATAYRVDAAARRRWPPGCSDERQRRLVRRWVRAPPAATMSSQPPYAW